MTQERITIELTGRPPIRIIAADWPCVASVEDRGPSLTTIDWQIWVRVLLHADGRAIVYGRTYYHPYFVWGRHVDFGAGMICLATDDLSSAIGKVVTDLAESLSEHGRSRRCAVCAAWSTMANLVCPDGTRTVVTTTTMNGTGHPTVEDLL